MKVYQLMTLLEKYPAGMEVRISMPAVMDAPIEHVGSDDPESVTISGADAQVINENGDEIGLLSEIAAVSDEE